MPEAPELNKGNKPDVKPEQKSPDVREPSNVRPPDKPTPDQTPRRESGLGDEKSGMGEEKEDKIE